MRYGEDFSVFARDLHVQYTYNKAAIEIDLEVVYCSRTRVAPKKPRYSRLIVEQRKAKGMKALEIDLG